MRSTLQAPFVAVALAALILGPCAAADERQAHPDAAVNSEVRVMPPENYCLGGIENGKVIVHESRLSDPFRQTTRLGCEVDGGDPRTMPDLPTPSPVHEVLV